MSNKTFPLASLSAAILSVMFTNSAAAADEKVETVLVSATRSEGPQMPVATQIKVITAEDIRVSGATTVAEALRTQAGIQILDMDGSGGRSVTVAMRGFSATAANNTLVLVDGRKLNNPSLVGPALNSVSIKDIERIEIIQGSAGVLYGDQAVGGVINVITRRAAAGEFNGSVSAEAGTGNLENYTASVRQGFENGLNYSLSAQKRNADNYRDNNQSALTNVLGNIGFNFDGGKVFVEKQCLKDDLNLAGNLLDSEAAINRRRTKTPTDYSNLETDLTRVGGEIEFVKNWRLLGEYSNREDDSLSYYGYGTPTPSELTVKTITPRIVGSIPTSNGNAVITVGYDKSESSYQTISWGTDTDQNAEGYYAQAIYPVTQKFVASIGARRASVEDINHLIYDINFNVIEKARNIDLNATELGLSYQIDDAWRVFARTADGFRFGNADENGASVPGVDFLDAQTSESQELGIAWTEKTASVKYSIYQMSLDNEIVYDTLSPSRFGGFGANINLPKSERKGFLFDGDVQLSEQITLHGNYTYTDAWLTEGNFKGKDVPYVAKNTGNIGLVFNFVPGVTTSIDANYTGSRYRNGDAANVIAKVDALTLFNFNILWYIDDVELGFRVKNITNEKYADFNGYSSTGKLYQYPQPERTYSAHVSYNF